MVAVKFSEKEPGDCWKGRAQWLLEALGAYYSHRVGYCLKPHKVEQFTALYKAGFSASRRILKIDKRPYTFSIQGGPEMTLKQALEIATC